MRPDQFLTHIVLSRRSALGLAGATALGVAGLAGASPSAAAGSGETVDGPPYDDVMFDVAFAEAAVGRRPDTARPTSVAPSTR